jgi:hypothetical protein
MAFGDFKYPQVIRDLGLIEDSADLFASVPSRPPSPATAAILPANVMLGTAAHSEAARSIWLVGPVLADLWAANIGRVNLFADVDFAADPENQLTGKCDFLLGRGPQLRHIAAPVAVIFEAKRDSIPDGLGQCVSAMVGVQRYNRREGREADPVYGCVSTGSLWQFLTLSGTTVTIDLTEYTITQVDRILGILTHIVGRLPG